MSSRDHRGRARLPEIEQTLGRMENGDMFEFPYHSCESSDGHNFPVRTPICAFLDSTESSLSIKFNKMKFLAKPWAEQWAGSRKVEERSVLVSRTSVFGIELYLKCSGLRMAYAGNYLLNFCMIFIKVEISALSLDFSEAKYGRIYGWEWLMCVITVN